MNTIKRYTVITGASSGIGYAAAHAFAGRRKHLILVARRKERLEEVKAELVKNNSALDVVVKCYDLCDIQNCYSLYEELKTYEIETWINNAGFGDYNSVASQDLGKVERMLRLNVEALTLLSSLFVRDYKDVEDTQLINLSSRGGYILVPNAVTYCASKFYVGAFTEGLAHELKAAGAKLRAKVLAPAATKTEFGMVANNTAEYSYNKSFSKYHTSEQVAAFILQLHDSNYIVGLVNWETFEFTLKSPIFEYAGSSIHNQSIVLD